MKATVTFTKEIEAVPTRCMDCPFVNICDQALPGITKRGGMQFTVSATRKRHKNCPLKVENEG